MQHPARLVQRTADFLTEYKDAQVQLRIQTCNPSVSRWHPPASNGFKLNFDAAIFQELHASGFGAIIRNETGEVMASLSAKGPAVVDSEEAEVLGFYSFIIEGDNRTVINSIRSIVAARANYSRLGHLYEDVGCLILGLHDVSISCVSRSANAAAHSLARYARGIEDEVVWLEDIPPPALQAVYLDAQLS